MKNVRVFSFLLFISCLIFSSCSSPYAEHEVSEQFVLSAKEISELIYCDGKLRSEDELSFPKNLAISLREQRDRPLIFVFFPSKKKLILVTEDIYFVPQSEWTVVGRDMVERVILLHLDVPYESTEELLQQDFWYGSVVQICSIGAHDAREPMLGAFEPNGVHLDSDLKAEGNVFGLYYPAEGEIVREFFENPQYRKGSYLSHLGFCVVSENGIDACRFYEIFSRYNISI